MYMSKTISWVTLSVCAVLLTGCTPTSTSVSNVSVANDDKPVLYNLGGVQLPDDVEFNQYSLDVASGKTTTVFIFSQPLPAHPGEPVRINPNIE
jgi:hypothetical protein